MPFDNNNNQLVNSESTTIGQHQPELKSPIVDTYVITKPAVLENNTIRGLKNKDGLRQLTKQQLTEYVKILIKNDFNLVKQELSKLPPELNLRISSELEPTFSNDFDCELTNSGNIKIRGGYTVPELAASPSGFEGNIKVKVQPIKIIVPDDLTDGYRMKAIKSASYDGYGLTHSYTSIENVGFSAQNKLCLTAPIFTPAQALERAANAVKKVSEDLSLARQLVSSNAGLLTSNLPPEQLRQQIADVRTALTIFENTPNPQVQKLKGFGLALKNSVNEIVFNNEKSIDFLLSVNKELNKLIPPQQTTISGLGSIPAASNDYGVLNSFNTNGQFASLKITLNENNNSFAFCLPGATGETITLKQYLNNQTEQFINIAAQSLNVDPATINWNEPLPHYDYDEDYSDDDWEEDDDYDYDEDYGDEDEGW